MQSERRCILVCGLGKTLSSGEKPLMHLQLSTFLAKRHPRVVFSVAACLMQPT
jgi:hypothetical protein